MSFRRSMAYLFLGLGALALGIGLLVAWLFVATPDPAPLAKKNPVTTALIEQRRAEAKTKRRSFHLRRNIIPLERVPSYVTSALLVSEDAGFYGHDGIDFIALKEAAEHDLRVGHFARGASTLTQQLAKNLYLGTEKSLVRKAKEAVLAVKLERKLSKRRILSLYLNSVEFGDSTFGIEAGARSRFGISASDLSLAQGVVLVSLLPAPLRVDLEKPSTWLRRRARRLLDRMYVAGRLDADAHRRAASELDRILAGPRPTDDEEEPPDEPAPEARAPESAPMTETGDEAPMTAGEDRENVAHE